MYKKLSLLLSTVLVISMFLTGCGGGSKATDNSGDNRKLAADQILRVSINDEPTSMDPAHYRDDLTGNIIYAVNEPLLRISNDEKGWEPGIATDYKVSDDKLTYTFMLRKDAKFADGNPIKAEDVVYSYRRIIDPKTASRKAFDFYFIKNGEAVNKGKMPVEQYGVKALDDYTVEISLEKPLDYFISLLTLTSFGVVEKSAVEQFGEYYGTEAEKTMSSGPFKIESWKHDSMVVLAKNENYWDAKNVTLNRIEINIVKDSNTLIGMYKTGQLDYMDVGADYLNEFKNTPEFKSLPTASVSFIEFNPNKDFLNNIKIRQALALTINRKLYVENILKNGDTPAYGLVPPGIKGKNGGEFREQNGNLFSDSGVDPANNDKAKKLLDEGLKEIGKTKDELNKYLKMHCIDSPNHKRLAQAIQQMWKENLGVNVQLVPLQVKMLIPILEKADFQILIGGGRLAPVNDPSDFIDFVYNENKWNDAEYKKLIEKSRETVGDERMDYLMKAEKMLVENAVFVPQNFKTSNYVIRKGVDGFRRYGSGVMFDYKHVKIYEEN